MVKIEKTRETEEEPAKADPNTTCNPKYLQFNRLGLTTKTVGNWGYMYAIICMLSGIQEMSRIWSTYTLRAEVWVNVTERLGRRDDMFTSLDPQGSYETWHITTLELTF